MSRKKGFVPYVASAHDSPGVRGPGKPALKTQIAEPWLRDPAGPPFTQLNE
jgi:hypothetical protein